GRFSPLPGTGDPMDDDWPLFSTFKPIGEDKNASARLGPDTASAKPGPDATPVQPQGAEQRPGHQDTEGRVGRGAAKGPSRPARRSWLSPPSCSPPEGDPRPELVALRAQTRLWFEQTQARRLEVKGELPAWFHGFISRRETEQLLQDQPPGCFLVRFSESTVGFVLSYRGSDRCRHFVLDQLPDGRYVILGERSAHAELADLLRHYTAAPVTPYHEFLTVPCRRVRTQPLVCPCSRKSGVIPAVRTRGDFPKLGKSKPREGKASRPGKNKAGVGTGATLAVVHREAGPAEPPTPPHPADAKYQQLMCFHTYAEPHEGIAPRAPTYYELEEPIPFYAVGRGSSPSAGPEENIYSEV
ncbi:SH22A protein, partial [Mesembrinibis cayennensis]|nr:SH22A protein [Mesembrinibis cayennensis]